MKKELITCEVIQDLLPLYLDGCCSEQSGRIVENHLADCADCRKKRQVYQKALVPEDQADDPDLKKIKRGMRKLTRWKRIGILALCLVFLLVFAVIPAYNYYVRWEGLTYANLKAAYTAHVFKNALASGDYEKAYELLDIRDHYDDLITTDRLGPDATEEDKIVMAGIREVEEKGFDWYEQMCRGQFFKNMNTLEELNENLASCSNFRIERQPGTETQEEQWWIFYHATTESGKNFTLRLDLQKGGVYDIIISTGYLTEGFGSRPEIIDEELEQQELMLSRFYISPSINEPVMEMLYDDTEYDWTKLFTY